MAVCPATVEATHDTGDAQAIAPMSAVPYACSRWAICGGAMSAGASQDCPLNITACPRASPATHDDAEGQATTPRPVGPDSTARWPELWASMRWGAPHDPAWYTSA